LRGRAASPYRPGLFVKDYLQSHGEAYIAEMHRAYKGSLGGRDVGPKHQRRWPTYESFRKYFGVLVRHGLVEFAHDGSLPEGKAGDTMERNDLLSIRLDGEPRVVTSVRRYFRLTPAGMADVRTWENPFQPAPPPTVLVAPRRKEELAMGKPAAKKVPKVKVPTPQLEKPPVVKTAKEFQKQLADYRSETDTFPGLSKIKAMAKQGKATLTDQETRKVFKSLAKHPIAPSEIKDEVVEWIRANPMCEVEDVVAHISTEWPKYIISEELADDWIDEALMGG
jgi:hypothetical protein